jgi:hypothetical protein
VPGAFDQPEARIDAAPDQRVILRLRRKRIVSVPPAITVTRIPRDTRAA